MLWINLQLTKTSKSFNFATLEEATFYQYAYGSSVDVIGQAARFVSGFAKLKPFTAANKATALVGMLAFLECNGHFLSLEADQVAQWADEVWADPSAAEAKITVLTNEHEVHGLHGVPDIRGTVSDILAKYSEALTKLVAEEPEATLV